MVVYVLTTTYKSKNTYTSVFTSEKEATDFYKSLEQAHTRDDCIINLSLHRCTVDGGLGGAIL